MCSLVFMRSPITPLQKVGVYIDINIDNASNELVIKDRCPQKKEESKHPNNKG